MPTLGPINEANLVENTDGGKAGRREAGLKSNNSLSAGRTQSLLGSRCGSTAIHWRDPAPPCAEAARIRGHESVRGATPFGRAFFVVGDLPARRFAKRQKSRRLIRPTEFASFQPTEEFGGKLRVPVGLAEGGHTTSKSSGGTRPFEANHTASMR